jgi:hypothetical protein
MKNCALVSLLLLLAGCDTVYQPLGWDGGYEDKALTDDKYWIKYLGNTTTTDSWVRQSWNKRASELCAGPFNVLKINTKTPNLEIKQIAELVNTPLNRNNSTMEGVIECIL